MKSPLFQLLASGVALGMMGGAVAIHAVHVSGAKNLGSTDQWSPVSTATISSATGKGVAGSSTGYASSSAGTGPATRSEMTTTVAALEEILSRLKELKTENQDLRGQLEETNLDLNELQFRIDTHSESFRPIPSSSGGLFRSGPMSSTTPSEIHPLLPPK